MSQYGKNTVNTLINGIKNKIKMEVAAVNYDNCNFHFVANNRKSRIVNIYRICSVDDMHDVVKTVASDLTGHVYA